MGDRADRLVAAIAEHELDCALITNILDVRYLTGFGGTNGACVCGDGLRLFLTDFRYTERAADEVRGWEIITLSDDWFAGLASHLKGRAGYEDDRLSVRTFEKLGGAVGDRVTLVPAGGMVERLRRVKDEDELAAIRAAAAMADEIYLWTIERGMLGRTESDVARALVAEIRDRGAEPSFDPIVAAGPNGALPHAEPGERVIGSGELIVFDMGVELGGYCSDCTRTFATGEPGELARQVYEIVLDAQEASLAAITEGADGRAVDAIAREMIKEAGYGERFGHGLGHGVGMEVHEAPRLSSRSEDTLIAGEVVTDEPGIYLPGELGVRIEDLVVVTRDRPEILTGLSKQITFVD